MHFRQYAGASINYQNNNWPAFSTSADTEIYTSLRLMRNRARQLCRDFSYAMSGVRNLALRIVGESVKFQSQLSDGNTLKSDLNSQIERTFAIWSRTCDVRSVHTFQDLMYICALSVIRDGEVFIRLVPRKNPRSPVPLQLELIEADQCPEWVNGNAPVGGGFTRMGIQYDQWRSPVQYAFLPYHPGDNFVGYPGERSGLPVLWVPAAEVIHLYLPDRVSQSRGVTALSSLMNELHQLSGYQEAELYKARGQAAIAGFVTSEDVAIQAAQESDGSVRNKDLSPGTIEYLQPGEEFQGFNPSSPNPSYGDFVKQLLKSMAAGLGLSYPDFSADPSEANYSSSRLASIANTPYYKRLQNKFADMLLSPIYEAWLNKAIAANAISIPEYFSPGFYPDHYWQFPGQPFIDPQGELQATQLALQLGLTTVTDEIAIRGGDIDDLIATKIAETEKLAKVKEVEQKLGMPPAGATDAVGTKGASVVPEQPTTPAPGMTAIPKRSLQGFKENNLAQSHRELIDLIRKNRGTHEDDEREIDQSKLKAKIVRAVKAIKKRAAAKTKQQQNKLFSSSAKARIMAKIKAKINKTTKAANEQL